MEIAATAHSLAERGVYGNPLFTGFAGSERRYHVFMPLYPVLLAGVFELFGTGLVQARGLSVACGLLTLVLTHRLGRAVAGPVAGAAAAATLCVVRLAIEPQGSGIPLSGFARIVRFDILVPVAVLAACLLFLRAAERGSGPLFVVAGALVGLAVLGHVWGGLLLPVLLGLLAWRLGMRGARPGALLLAGFLLALVPWIAFVLQDPESFVGQMRRHQGRFELLSLRWYLGNLLHEHWRYAPWVGGAFRDPVLWPRPGLWLFAIGACAGNAALLSRVRRDASLGHALLLVAPPVMAVLMGLLVNQKRYPYTLLVLPFLSLQVGVGLSRIGSRGVQLPGVRWALGALCLASVLESGAAATRTVARARAATPYALATRAVTAVVPTGSRVLIPHPLWMALRDREARSLVLVHFLADARLHPGGVALPMDDALRRAAPDYVVLEDRFTRYHNPSNPQVEGLWRRLTDSVRRLCPDVVGRFDVPGYEPAAIHHCAPEVRGA
jgi:4-amino-4-deoxy-L-arabinose transferase-like glycosyltransferase